MVNHYSQRAVASIVIPVLFTALSTVMVILRIMGRRVKRVSLWLDDYAIIASLCVAYPLMILIVVSATNLGAGRHVQEVPPNTLRVLLKALLATQFAWSVSVALVKLGILLFYLRIFNTKEDRLATFFMMGVAMCWMLSAVVGGCFQCRPLSSTWTHRPADCNARVRFWVAIGISHIVIDILILLLPVRMVWKLLVPLTTKIGLYFLFGLGSVNAMDLFNRICLISGFRLRVLDDVSHDDVSYSLPIPHIWSALEPTVAICTACLPVARPVFLRYFPSSVSKPPTGRSVQHSQEPQNSAEPAAAGFFRRLSEQEVPVKEMRSQVATGKERGGDSETTLSNQAVERDLEGIRVVQEWDVRY
ncbi:hypothetical protein MMC07_004828 [Pseudocyphellaria aurata]|nr:hypothetical protein [Pseudocyphellaria aurata]